MLASTATSFVFVVAEVEWEALAFVIGCLDNTVRITVHSQSWSGVRTVRNGDAPEQWWGIKGARGGLTGTVTGTGVAVGGFGTNAARLSAARTTGLPLKRTAKPAQNRPPRAPKLKRLLPLFSGPVLYKET